MVDNRSHELDRLFYALSDPTRRAMLAQLAKKECSVGELARPHNLTFAGISKHLKVLEASRFVEKMRDGRTFRCRANLKPLEGVYALLEELGAFWRTQLDALEVFLNNDIQEPRHEERTKHARPAKSSRQKKSQRKS